MRRKLNTDRGETLVEVLASILIASLSVALLFGCVMASSNMDRDAKELDKKHYEALTAAEVQNKTAALGVAKVEIENPNIEKDPPGLPDELKKNPKPLDVNIYGGAELYSYKRADP